MAHSLKGSSFRFLLSPVHVAHAQSTVSHTGRLDSCIFTARKRSLGQGNIFTSVCHSVHRARSPPPSRQIPRDSVNEQAVRILLECILVDPGFSVGTGVRAQRKRQLYFPISLKRNPSNREQLGPQR